MPRLSQSKHPVARVRQILGLEQKKLAALIKVSPRTIQDIERGKLPLSRHVAARLVIVTGVKLDSLLHPDQPLLDVTDSPYVAESKQRYGQEKLRDFATNFAIEKLNLSLGLIVEAANEAGQALLVCTEIEMALHDIVEKFDLKKHYNRTMRIKRGGTNLKAWRAEVRDFRAGRIWGWADGGERFFPWLFAEELVSKKHFNFLRKRITNALRPDDNVFGIDFDDPKVKAAMDRVWDELPEEPKTMKQRSRQRAVTTAAEERKKVDVAAGWARPWIPGVSSLRS